jgi:HTH-type transcriptional regulator, cell division transcriptional repressor
MTVPFLDSVAVGRRIRAAREASEIGGAEFARRIGIEARTLYRLEGGANAPSAGVLAAIAQALGITTDWLLTGEGDGPDDHVSTVTKLTEAREVCG